MTSTRVDLRKLIVANYLGHQNFDLEALPVDCSYRSYYRVKDGDKVYILMDSPPDKEDPGPFIKIANILKECGISAPEIYYSDLEDGLVLIEDFGDTLFKKFLLETPEKREELYKAAIDLLIFLQKNYKKSDNVNDYDDISLMREVNIFTEWYFPFLLNHKISIDLQHEYENLWKNLFGKISYKTSTLVLRDYHVENLMFLNDREGLKSVGVIDFQDALHGSYAYDLVSLLEDARINVPQEFRNEMIEYYLNSAPHVDRKNFLNDYLILGAQRDIKIIGIFARKFLRDQNDKYLKYIPRMWQYIKDNIQSPILSPLKEWLNKVEISVDRLSDD